MTSRTVTVVNQLGMHARAAAKFVHLASQFQSRIIVARQSRDMCATLTSGSQFALDYRTT